MEDKNQNDKLDDFLRKSFDGYEEDPASYMWGRIAADLPRGESGMKLAFRRYAVPLAAASVLVLMFSGLLFWQHQRYNAGMAELHLRLEKAEKTQQEMAERLEAAAAMIPAAPAATPSAPEPADLYTAPYRQPLGKGAVADTRNTAGNHRPTIGVAEKTPDEVLAVPEKQEVVQVNKAPEQTQAITTVSAVSPLLARPSILSLQNNMTLLMTPSLITPVKEKPGRMYVGLQHSIMWGKETGGKAPGNDFGPFKNYHHTSNESEEAWVHHQTWLKVGKPVLKNVFVESGIGYQQFERNITHRPDLEFRDRDFHHHHGGPPFGLHDFQYTFNTYNGTGEVELRVAESSSGNNIDDNEPLNLEIEASETAKIVSVPLLLGVKAGKSKLKGVFKAGVVANYLASDKFEVTKLNSINDKFNTPQLPDFDVQLDKGDALSFGYLASAGLEYPIAPSLSLVAESIVTGDLKQRSNTPFSAGTSSRSLGLNVGVNYTF